MNQEVFFSLIIYVIVVILVFLLLREFWCWYFKINKVVSLLEKIVNNTNSQNPIEEKTDSAFDDIKCSKCGVEVELDDKEKATGSFKCFDCGYINVISK